LLKYEVSRGYRFGWARKTFLDRFGTTPPFEWEGDSPASFIRPESFRWLRVRAAEYARQCAARGK
jgi:hypothetical protein